VIQVTAQMRVLVAIEPVDFRRGIDGLARICRDELKSDPFSGTIFVFCNRRRTGVRLLTYDGQGYWLLYKRLSTGQFRHWPGGRDGGVGRDLLAHELQVLLAGGDPDATRAAPQWRRLALPAGA